jgi:hypothetical protein
MIIGQNWTKRRFPYSKSECFNCQIKEHSEKFAESATNSINGLEPVSERLRSAPAFVLSNREPIPGCFALLYVIMLVVALSTRL